jgi:hypothetical protein
MTRFIGCVLLLFIVAFTATLCSAQANRKTVRVACGTKNACFPWQPQGPKCGRGNRMNLRFMLSVAPENYRIVNNETISSVTYAFCPIVDELQAFNLSSAIRNAATYAGVAVDPDTGFNVPARVKSQKLEVAHLSIFGLGDVDETDPARFFFPNATTSYGSVGIVFNTTDCNNEGELGMVSFLVLNITLANGLYKYYEDFRMPTGAGFSPTCDGYGVCLLDPSMKCFGEPGKQNCGECTNVDSKLATAPLQIWTSYYGTDAFGRQMRSGSSNPLNFRAFSGGGVYASMRRSYNNIRDGNTVDESDLSPDATGG